MEDDWIRYELKRPPIGILCQFGRYTDQNCFPQIANRWTGFDNFRDDFNVAGLHWRLTGVGREQLESMSPEARMQIERPQNSNYGQLLNSLLGQSGANCGQGIGPWGGAFGSYLP